MSGVPLEVARGSEDAHCWAKVGRDAAPRIYFRIWCGRNFHLLLNLNKWKIITDRTVTHGTVTQNLEISHWGLSLKWLTRRT